MVFSLALSTGFIIWDLNFANSGSKEVMKEFLGQYAGRYQITHPDYYAKTTKKEFSIYKTLSDEDIKDPGVMRASTKRVTAPVFISGQKKTLGVLLSGIDVAKELRLSHLHEAVTFGRYLSETQTNEVIIGKKLAQRIEARVGDEVAVIGQAVDGSVANELLTVVGLLDFGGGDLEESLAFTQLSSAQVLLGMDHKIYHQRVSFDLTEETLPVLPNLSVTSWTELLPEISVSVRFIDNFTWIVSIVIVFVISLGISNTLMITFFEREREFQSLNVIGVKGDWILKSLMVEVLLMGTTAILCGVGLGYLATTYCYYHPINIELFTGGKPIIMGGMIIQPLVRLYPVAQYFWQVPLVIYLFLLGTMIYPLLRIIKRNRHAV
jgi:putative ABC transport system permease protein